MGSLRALRSKRGEARRGEATRREALKVVARGARWAWARARCAVSQRATTLGVGSGASVSCLRRGRVAGRVTQEEGPG